MPLGIAAQVPWPELTGILGAGLASTSLGILRLAGGRYTVTASWPGLEPYEATRKSLSARPITSALRWSPRRLVCLGRSSRVSGAGQAACPTRRDGDGSQGPGRGLGSVLKSSLNLPRELSWLTGQQTARWAQGGREWGSVLQGSAPHFETPTHPPVVQHLCKQDQLPHI